MDERWEPLERVEMGPCPVCGAQAGELCRNPDGSTAQPIAHEERIEATLVALSRQP